MDKPNDISTLPVLCQEDLPTCPVPKGESVSDPSRNLSPSPFPPFLGGWSVGDIT